MIRFASPKSYGVDDLPLDTDYVPTDAHWHAALLADVERATADDESCDVDLVDAADELCADVAPCASLVEIEPAEWIAGGSDAPGDADDISNVRQLQSAAYQGYWPLTDREADVLNALIGVHRGNLRRTLLGWLAAVGVSMVAAGSLAAAIFWGAVHETGRFLLPKLVDVGSSLNSSVDGIDG